jgi:putative permease
MRNVIRYSAVILLTLAGLVVLWEFREAIILFLLSLAIGAVFRPAVERLVRLGFSRVLAILLLYFAALVGFGALIYFISGPLGKELQQATDNFAVAYTRLRREWGEGEGINRTIASQLPPLDYLYRAIAGDQGLQFFQAAAGVATGFFGFVSGAAIVLALSMYWSADQVYFERLWLTLLPAGNRSQARTVWRKIEQGVGAYIRSEFIQSILIGLLLGLTYSLLGLRYPTLLALIGAMAWLIPWVGGVLALIPAFIIALEGGLGVALAAAFLVILIMALMEFLVERRIFNRSRYSSVLLVLVMIVLADSFGLLGLIIAPPLAAAIQIAGADLLLKPSAPTLQDPDARITALEARLERVRQEATTLEEPSPHIENLIARLERLLEQAKAAL